MESVALLEDVAIAFEPWPSLVEGHASRNCRAIVIVPARNEEASLTHTLDALSEQVDDSGKRLAAEAYEIILLLNNCTDDSVAVAQRWKHSRPDIALHLVERALAPDEAHVGTARRWLMDTAWRRLSSTRHAVTAILSTDSDTIVAPDWIASNLRALEQGADAVGGAIKLKPGELGGLPAPVQEAYLRDREYQRLVAMLEDRLDPQLGDACPRHVEHFGASLACTPQMYAAAGGLPAVNPLEDMAFVEALRNCGAILRHDPQVVVRTSARLDGRAEVGLSWQLRVWQDLSERGDDQRVACAEWLAHRFATLRRLRELHSSGAAHDLRDFPSAWAKRLRESLQRDLLCGQFLAEIDCEQMIEESFDGERDAEITAVNAKLEQMLRQPHRSKSSSR